MGFIRADSKSLDSFFVSYIHHHMVRLLFPALEKHLKMRIRSLKFMRVLDVMSKCTVFPPADYCLYDLSLGKNDLVGFGIGIVAYESEL